MKTLAILPILTFSAAAALPPDHAEKMTKGLELFKKEVAPLFKEHCIKCHGGEKVKGDLDMATREGLLKGGSEGPSVEAFDSASSYLMKLIRHEEEPHMPEKKPKLPETAIAAIAKWIDLGAPYDAPLVEGKAPPKDRSVVTAEDRRWWSFQPLARVTPPVGAAHPIDAFLLDAAKAKGMNMNPPADARTLVRRASLGVTGLPPTPAEVADFVQNPDMGKLADRLLASPAYGERWARHWLDVARFAESSGFEHDYDRPYAYYFRDFVIRALNADMPFDQFARWQLAGDEFAPGNPEALMATGFLGAGVFPTQITANEVERTRYDALDDMLSTTSSAFLGLSVGCARCHDHKYDPIPTADYYRMLSTFTTTVRSNVELQLDADAAARQKTEFEAEQKRLNAELAALEQGDLRKKFEAWISTNQPLPLSSWSVMDVVSIDSKGGAKFKKQEDGSWLAEGKNANSDIYTVSGRGRGTVTGLKLEALTHASAPHNGPGRAGNGNFALSKIRVFVQPDAGGARREISIASAKATHQQNTNSLSVASSLDDNPKSGWAVDFGGIGKDQAAAFKFGEPVVLGPEAKLTVVMEFEVNTGHNLVRPRLSLSTGGAPELNAAALPAQIAALSKKLSTLSAAEKETLFAWWKTNDAGWKASSLKIAEHSKKAPKSGTPVMVCAEGYKPIVMHSQGAPFFKETHILKRGDTNQKQSLASQSFLQVLMREADEKRWQWEPPAGSQYSGRRRSFANWLTDTGHGAGVLMARVAVNRLWHHHFGRGLVASPNDFGKTGMPPSNPALLDWLAGELIRNGWKVKPIHRLILTSAAYQQSSSASAQKAAADPENQLFMRRVPQRLESEIVRDSILAVSGVLEPTMFGPGTLNEDSKRRSIYFTVKRSRLLNSMVVFDAPEPLTSSGARPTTTVAPQALLLMNSRQARQWAGAFAQRVKAASGSSERAALVGAAYTLALSRPPRESETRDAVEFLESASAAYAASGKTDGAELALKDFCQAVLALNEFVYVH